MQADDPFPLRQAKRPVLVEGGARLRIVDLFAGCGGLSLGIEQAATSAGIGLDIALALDSEEAASAVYKANFPNANVITGSVETYFDGQLGDSPTSAEEAVGALYRDIAFLVGGPPCQGHSNLNNKTRRNDPKNELYARMGRAAEILQPNFVLIENVPSVRRDTDQVVQKTVDHLKSLGYDVATAVVSLHALGIAQTRRRHVLLASADRAVSAQMVLDNLNGREADRGKNLRWAIGDLIAVGHPMAYDREPQANPTNLARMRFLLEHHEYDLPPEHRPKCHQKAHTYKSMYGRLNWDDPAQTVTSGFGSIGQGRYMHPEKLRALTAHEAARLQGFPDYFDFSAIAMRSKLAIMIGNAVPPALMREAAILLIPALGFGRHPIADPVAQTFGVGLIAASVEQSPDRERDLEMVG
jgi:DNA (cytosine-5)-methyltransferase 1